jgi:hypothetical protein
LGNTAAKSRRAMELNNIDNAARSARLAQEPEFVESDQRGHCDERATKPSWVIHGTLLRLR